jgi:hypothetical protein
VDALASLTDSQRLVIFIEPGLEQSGHDSHHFRRVFASYFKMDSRPTGGSQREKIKDTPAIRDNPSVTQANRRRKLFAPLSNHRTHPGMNSATVLNDEFLGQCRRFR